MKSASTASFYAMHKPEFHNSKRPLARLTAAFAQAYAIAITLSQLTCSACRTIPPTLRYAYEHQPVRTSAGFFMFTACHASCTSSIDIFGAETDDNDPVRRRDGLPLHILVIRYLWGEPVLTGQPGFRNVTVRTFSA